MSGTNNSIPLLSGSGSKRPACYNRPPFADGYWAPDGYTDIVPNSFGEVYRTQRFVWIPNRMTRGCATQAAGEHVRFGFNCTGCCWLGKPNEEANGDVLCSQAEALARITRAHQAEAHEPEAQNALQTDATA